jgi:hypothetical protein
MAVMFYSRYKLVTASLPKRLRTGRFASETTFRHLDPDVVKNIR